jgi:hypothetical protein
MKAIIKRLHRLEDLLEAADEKPQHVFRMVVRRLDRLPSLDGATCRRTLWPNGTVGESVVLGTGRDGRELTDEELDEWIDSFPIESLQMGIRHFALPTDGPNSGVYENLPGSSPPFGISIRGALATEQDDRCA